MFVTSYCTIFASTLNFRIEAHTDEQFGKGRLLQARDQWSLTSTSAIYLTCRSKNWWLEILISSSLFNFALYKLIIKHFMYLFENWIHVKKYGRCIKYSFGEDYVLTPTYLSGFTNFGLVWFCSLPHNFWTKYWYVIFILNS